ncbi:unnamed protein product, partial [Meganyctiphanes norvegica]
MKIHISLMVNVSMYDLKYISCICQVLVKPDTSSIVAKSTELNMLESRLHRLEDDIKSNQLTIKEIKNLVSHLASLNIKEQDLLGPRDAVIVPNKFSRNSGNLISNVVDNNKPAKGVVPSALNISSANVAQDDCIFSHTSSSPVDIQMQNVYDLLTFDNPDGGAWKQGWNIEYDASKWSETNKLKVFVVPHSHNDPGWIKTYEKYYEDQTRKILDNMAVKLPQEPRRKFIWAEMSYLSMWWEQQSQSTKDTVKRLADRGQLEIVTGGWVMNDEANTHYFAMLEQLVEGHEWLKLNLGVKPNSGWAIDPFGMTPTMAYLLKRMGLENMLIQRVHYSVKKHLAREQSLEFFWRQTWDTASSTDMFCHMMPFYSYDVPHTCGPEPKVCCQFDFLRLPGGGITCPWRVPPQAINQHNVESRANILLDQYRKKSELYKTNVVLVPLGDDFRYVKSEEWDNQYSNYQKLFDYMNSKEDLHVEAQFGTLADYFRAVHAEGDAMSGQGRSIFPSLSGDFFTYADRDDHYWSGYYTSRPFYKNMDRVLEGYIRGADILFSSMLASEKSSEVKQLADALMVQLVSARRNLALFQHHDGITGTAKDHVVVDYAKKMLDSIRKCQHIIQHSAHRLLSSSKGTSEASGIYMEAGETMSQHFSIRELTLINLQEDQVAPVVMYNPDAHPRKQLFTVRTSTPYIQVSNEKGADIACQVNPVFVNGYQISDKKFDVSFLASLPSLSLTTYKIRAVKPATVNAELTHFASVSVRNQNLPASAGVFSVQKDSANAFTLQNNVLRATFNENGLLKDLTVDGHTVSINLIFAKYGARLSRETSGAYLFFPDKEAVVVPINQPPIVVIRGPIISKVTVNIKNVQHILKIKNSPGVDGLGVDITNYVDITKERNFELIMRFNTDIASSNIFYTDLNGFQSIKRVKYSKLPLQANYYPIPSHAFIEDEKTRLTLLSGQPLGGSSLKPGQLEIMLDRRLNQDDNRGVEQGVLDNVNPTANVFRLMMEPRLPEKEWSVVQDGGSAFLSLAAHAAMADILYPSYTLLPTAKSDSLSSSWSSGGALPCDVHLVNLRTMLGINQRSPDPTTALTLHRQGFDCGFKANGLSCATNGGKIQLSSLFPHMFEDRVYQMSLSLLYEGVNMTKSYTLSLQPMELYAFRLLYKL